MKNLVGCAYQSSLFLSMILKLMIPLFMTVFEALNPTIEACTFTNAHGDEFENEGNIRLELPLRSLFE